MVQVEWRWTRTGRRAQRSFRSRGEAFAFAFSLDASQSAKNVRTVGA